MKIYTKTGDQGMTSLLTGERIDKASLRVEAYGTVDEVNSALGLARACCQNSDVVKEIFTLQKLLMLLMAELASTELNEAYITPEHVAKLEEDIDFFDAALPEITAFIIPGDSKGSAALDLARTITRRAERQTLQLAKQEAVNQQVLLVLNRLSDLCFVLSRAENIIK